MKKQKSQCKAVEVTLNSKEKNSKIFVWISFKNAASGFWSGRCCVITHCLLVVQGGHIGQGLNSPVTSFRYTLVAGILSRHLNYIVIEDTDFTVV